MDDIIINPGEYHSITFESSYIQQIFRILLSNYFSNKRKSERIDGHYIKIVSKTTGNTLQRKDIYFINFDCNVIALKTEKSTNKLLQDLLFYHLENNATLLENFIQLNEEITRFTSAISLEDNNLFIDFEPTDKTIQNLIKSLTIHIEFDESEYVPNYLLREYLIKSLLQLNTSEKDVFLVISFPESDVGREDFSKVADGLKKLNITTLVLTTKREFITSASSSNISMVDKNGFIYDIIKMMKEIEAFNLVSEDKLEDVTKDLVYRDFTKDFMLLDTKMKEFLASSKFY